MRRLFASVLLGLLSLLVPVAPSHACKWDRDTRNSEREFKSQYEDSPGVKSLSPGGETEPSQGPTLPVVVTGTGAVLLLGALALTFNRLGRERV
jgi:hypothetical protein